ncbi:MAG: hypothetical protein AUK37_02725 [Rhodobacterales bacterium CG2_30_65_12]|nr:MAG: hypothetical protein AUK37_02725 [Rhodobacterales bacterium CG2_30_65_12]
MDATPLSCDVLIVGGGPAGLSVAAALPDDVTCVIVHQDKEIGRPVRTSGGSWLKDVERLGIPSEMYNVVRRADAYADKAHAEIPLGDETVVILDTARLYKWLAAQSDHKNRKLLLATKFLTTRRRGDGLFESDIRARDGAIRQVVSRFLVDGSGWHSAVLTALGLGEKPGRLGVGTEYEYPIGSNPPDRAIVFVGTKVPSGYGWAFPTATGTIRVGTGVIQPDTDANSRQLLDGVVGNPKLLRRYGLKLDGPPIEVHSGILPSVAYTPNLVFGNVIRVGDSANFATPTLGEGIRQCIELGRVAGQALGLAVKTGKSAPLKAYERAARRQLARNYKWGFLVNTRYAGFTPKHWNAAVRRIGAAGPDAAVAVLRSEFGRRKIALMSWNLARTWLRKRLFSRG